jgi:hypothetical protein
MRSKHSTPSTLGALGHAPARNAFLVALALAAPLAPVAMTAGFASGCGGPPQGPDAPLGADRSDAGGAGAGSTSADAGVSAPVVDATPEAASALLPTPDAAIAAVDAGPPPPCWAGFKATGNAVTDVTDLGERCTKGMSAVIPPVKQSFAQGEKKQLPLIVPGPGCYRIIAVGGTGVKDVDLEVRDPSGKLVAADNTPDDIFPMIHPNKEWCPDAAQFLTLSIIVKKGAGEVAGGVWKR